MRPERRRSRASVCLWRARTHSLPWRPGSSRAEARLSTLPPGAAANIVAVGGTPESTVVGTPFPLPLVAQVTDSFANPVPNTTITFTVVPSGGAGGTFGGSSTASATTDQQGQAVAPTLIANTTAGTFTVTATVGGKTATWTLTNLAGAVSQITFETQPSTTAAGAPISPPVVVKLADSHGNPVGGATVVLTAKEGPGSLEGTQTAVTAGTGQVTFADLTLTASGSYQIEASAVGVLQRSATFQVTAKTTNLSMQVIDGTAQSASIGTTYALPLQVLVLDEFANPVPGASVLFTVTFRSRGASVTFNGSPAVITDAAGIATSPTMTANLVIGLVAPVATTPGAALPAVFALANTAGPATQLVFVQQPTNTAAGAAIVPPVTAQLLDAAGNLASQGGVTVTVQLSPPGGGFSPGSAPATQNTAGGRRGYVRRSRCRTGGYIPVTGAIRGASIGNQRIVRHRRRDFIQHHRRGRQQSVGCGHDELCHPAQSQRARQPCEPCSRRRGHLHRAVQRGERHVLGTGDRYHGQQRRCRDLCHGQCDGGLFPGDGDCSRRRGSGSLQPDQRRGLGQPSGIRPAAFRARWPEPSSRRR